MKDTLIKAISKDGKFRAFALLATETVAEAALRHGTWSTSTVALGRSLMAGAILGANQKGNDKITLRILSENTIGQITVDANANGQLKGYVGNPYVDLKKTATGEVMVGTSVAPGFLYVIKDMGLKEPYTGQVPLTTGEIGEDLAYYFTESEQIPSAVGLSVLLDIEDRVKIAGGFLVQAMPDATSEDLIDFENRLQAMPAISEILEHSSTQAILDAIFGSVEYKVLAKEPLCFFCDCSKEKFTKGLISLGRAELEAILIEDQKAEVVCHFCGEKYHYNQADLEAILEQL
ncbi:MAG: Hsp33 family molecular chaperone HslO [Streptococcaceae bacterium]|jgi:molecular chaperone Hsp33|nr:Hsp33 family molecular chaperone HslO [Streptococcaceae bacterium]